MGIRGTNSLKSRIIVILGPNASGKTGLSIKLALFLNSKKNKEKYGISGVEIISADSRQVYKGLDIGSGKIRKKEMKGITHHLIDVISPKKIFTVADYKKIVIKKIKELHKKDIIPIIVGGTGLYIDSVIKNIEFPKVSPNWSLRKKLEKKSKEELFLILKKLDNSRAKNIDKNNKRRLIRAIEIIKETGKKVPIIEEKPIFNSITFGVKREKEELKKLIKKRLNIRFKQGMIKEVENLHKKGVSYKRFEELGLEYRYIALYLQNKLSLEEMKEKLEIEINKYAKRQMTWFKRDKNIIWIKNFQEIKKYF